MDAFDVFDLSERGRVPEEEIVVVSHHVGRQVGSDLPFESRHTPMLHPLDSTGRENPERISFRFGCAEYRHWIKARVLSTFLPELTVSLCVVPQNEDSNSSSRLTAIRLVCFACQGAGGRKVEQVRVNDGTVRTGDYLEFLTSFNGCPSLGGADHSSILPTNRGNRPANQYDFDPRALTARDTIQLPRYGTIYSLPTDHRRALNRPPPKA
jgi:hypothetical protein